MRTEDLESEEMDMGSQTDAMMNPDDDFDSRLVPNASAFFELYNPWLSPPTGSTGTGSAVPPELYDNGLTGVDLALTSPDGAPVWRLVVFDPNSTTTMIRPDLNLPASDVRDNPMIEQLVDGAVASNSNALVRIAYFVQPDPALADNQFVGNKVYFPSTDGIARSVVSPGGYAVVGSAGQEPTSGEFTTYIGRTVSDATLGISPNDLMNTQRFVIDPSSDTFTWETGVNTVSSSDVVAIALDQNGTGTDRSFGITDPVEGYAAIAQMESGDPSANVMAIADGFQFVVNGMPVTFDRPIDRVPIMDADWPSHPLNHRGLISGYRVVYLQRLANPLADYDPLTNPYRIVDSSAIDLFVFNGLVARATETAAGTMPPMESPQPMSQNALSTYERTEENTPDARERGLLWRTSVLGDVDPEASTALTGHVLGFELQNTLGRLNSFYLDNNPDENPFPWLAWNNRPYANRYELVNVPYTSAHWLTRVFDTRGDGIGDTYSAMDHQAFMNAPSDDLKQVIHPNAAAFPHLLNFEADASNETDRMHQIFDFLEVPSRFAGANEYVEPTTANLQDDTAEADFGYRLSPPFDELPTYRYPGKVNLSTVSSEFVWDALLGARDSGGVLVDGPYVPTLSFSDWRNALADSPVRPAVATNYVPTGTTVPGSANVGLFRSKGSERTAGTAVAMGDETEYRLAYHQVGNPFNNTDRNAFFRNGIRQRLGGVATNRSSVFAIWVTVGYFQWDPITNDFQPPTDPSFSSTPPEFGEETGTVQRSRGFFIFDRSIPMAYEPGEDHNVDRGILLQSLIE